MTYTGQYEYTLTMHNHLLTASDDLQDIANMYRFLVKHKYRNMQVTKHSKTADIEPVTLTEFNP